MKSIGSRVTRKVGLGWDKHTPDGFEKCKQLIEHANVYLLDDDIASKTIELKRVRNINLADAVIAATAIVHNLKLATRNIDDFKTIKGLVVENPFK
jgi:predicted nucleic acid-binding protein